MPTGQAFENVAGIEIPFVTRGDKHSYWKYVLNVDANEISGGTDAVGAALKERGIFSAPRYIRKPAFLCQIFRDQQTFGSSRWPFSLAAPEAVDYREELFPGTFQALSKVLVLPWNEAYTEGQVAAIGDAIVGVADQLRG